MKSNLSKWLAIILPAAVVLGGTFSLGAYYGSHTGTFAVADGTSTPAVDMTPFWQVWKLIDDKFYAVSKGSSTPPTITNETKVEGAISGLVNSLGDPYTVFLPPPEKKQFEDEIRGNFGGVGIELGVKNAAIVVVAPLPGTPAARAGVLPGDRIVKIDGVDVTGWPVEQAVDKIRGEIGTTVTISVERGEKNIKLDFKLTRETINIPTLETKKLPNGIFLISLHNFSEQSASLFRGALREFVESKDSKLILDLRGNPGGYLEAAVDMASWFLPAGQPVVTEDHRGETDDKTYRSYGYNIFANHPIKMIILVDQGTASAAEILAGALDETKVATLLGQKTFGKGSVQELIPIAGDSDLKITIARWLTPLGHSLATGGLEPEVTIERTPEMIKSGLDPQLDKAIQLLNL